MQLGPPIEPSEWKGRPMNDFSQIHRICSYMAMFPPNLANYFIERFTKKGDLVIDPFCGRGTTPLEAHILERDSIGSDLNPLATMLSRGKLAAPTGIDGMVKVLKRIQELEDIFSETRKVFSKEAKQIRRKKANLPSVGVVFGQQVLEQLLFLRMKLIKQESYDAIDLFIISIILGAMHGSSDSYFSVSMPNTFSMSPNYIQKFVNENKLKYPNRNIFAIIRERATVALYSAHDNKNSASEIYDLNAENIGDLKIKKLAKLIFSSPPYLKVIKYGQYNWIRLWFLDIPHKEVDAELSDNLALDDYLEFMSKVITSSRRILDDDGLACWVIGDVNKGKSTINLAEKVWEKIEPTGEWELHSVTGAPKGIIVDEIAPSKKVTRIWNSGGHEIWHDSQDIETDEYFIHVETQSQADSKLLELGDGYYSVPRGASGQATPLDRILMIKPVGAKVFDRKLKDSTGHNEVSKPNSNHNLHVSRPYLKWLIDHELVGYNRYIRRLSKMDIVRVIFDKLGHQMSEEDISGGSTIKRSVLEKLWKLITEHHISLIPKTKHKILEDILVNLTIDYDKKTDTSASSTVTKLGAFKILAGLEKRDKYSGK